ncbi:helix-turn-helix transcriptional regulator [Bradyrhizobium sp. DOA1]|uniref:helix-turn-helix domain-containing protein n=1 Tax=Bradyrhizobium sp. DOA1 TaxID=1126616 RepID=UPI00077C4F67|nr:helix-turn-helix transcriptional regulator [Bradyrhizobium sp. DOA1]
MASEENADLSNFCKNIRYLAALYRLKHGSLATELGWDRTVVTKLMSGKRKPNTTQLTKLALFFRVPAADLEGDHEQFCAGIAGASASSDLPLLAFRTLRENTQRWQATFDKYRGQYVLYYVHDPELVIGSLLTLDRITGDGLHAKFINPHRDAGGHISAYEYEGYGYPVREYIYFLLEQKNANYEILSIILRDSATPTVHLMKGMVSGIGVRNETSFIAARPLVAIKRNRAIDDWRSALGNDLGYLPRTRIPEGAQRQLSSEGVTVQA